MREDELSDLRAVLAEMNDKQRRGRTYASMLLALPTHEWEAQITMHPEWLCAGTLNGLLAEADRIAATDIMRALSITSFVIAHAGDPGGRAGQVHG
jgi:hypothetical protein